MGDLEKRKELLASTNPDDLRQGRELTRKRISDITQEMLLLLIERQDLMGDIAQSKSQGDPILDLNREFTLLSKSYEYSQQNADPKMLQMMIWQLMAFGKEKQRKILGRDSVFIKENISDQELKSNLIQLTDFVADKYNEYGDGFNATKFTLEYEESMIVQEIHGIKDKALALDLGCADGRISRLLSQEGFAQVKGVDISPKFIDLANKKSGISNEGYVAHKFKSLDYQIGDISSGIPSSKIEDDSVDFLVANFGAASEVHSDILSQVKRVLKPGGKALLTFYNKNCPIHERWQPSQTSIEGVLNVKSDILEVPIMYDEDNQKKSKVFKIFAKAYSPSDVYKKADEHGLKVSSLQSYPSILNTLPPMFFENDKMVDDMKQREKTHSHMAPHIGFYITAVVTK